MATFSRNVTVNWAGSIMEGKGQMKAGSGAFDLPVSFPRRVGDAQGVTSPEELMAAAHAACYAMAFSNTLDKAGSPPERLHVTAVCSLDRVDGKMKIVSMDLNVQGVVPGKTQAEFEELAKTAEQGCPVSNALRGNVEIRLTAALES